jgi:Na+-transporting methylmalonyl-CoA/oxaloacetate decarboxylase gamma subunit
MLLSDITTGIIFLSLLTDMIAIVSRINGNSEVKKEIKKERKKERKSLSSYWPPLPNRVNIIIIYIYIS